MSPDSEILETDFSDHREWNCRTTSRYRSQRGWESHGVNERLSRMNPILSMPKVGLPLR